ncbi:MAG: hypothetical protein J0M12_13720 [Deltaproteobacteria bacterium]|nr:hypothetical protein [Deltaproteobacteria bacterium]
MRSFLFVFALMAVLSPGKALSEDPLHETTSLLVHIRTIRASHPIEVEATEHEKSDAPAPGKVKFDSRIVDLASKLNKLHFRCFKLISSQDEVIPLGKRETLSLVEGNQLTLRPLTLDSKRVGMWLKWQDSSGMQVLDTRMHFDLGESMVTGIDGAADSGLILAIDVQTVDQHAPVAQPVSAETSIHEAIATK